MRKLLIAFTLFLAVLSASGQGLFKPVPSDLFKGDKAPGSSVWLFRPVVQLTGMQFTLVKPVQVSSLSSLGTGISYTHFIEQNGEPYANFGVNGMLLFSQDLAGVEPASMGLALTISALQYVNAGVGYMFGGDFFILTGVSFNFNK